MVGNLLIALIAGIGVGYIIQLLNNNPKAPKKNVLIDYITKQIDDKRKGLGKSKERKDEKDVEDYYKD